jgi:hypothetical protein
MPPGLLRKMLLLLGDEVDEVDEVDEICLSLTSGLLAAFVRQFWVRPCWCSTYRVYHPRDDPDKMNNWYELAMCLDDSMLESLQFCHHRLIYLPKSSFGTRRTLVCFDCLLLMKRRCQYDECDGCGILHGLLADANDGRCGGT